MKTKLWIARDKSGTLKLYEYEPHKSKSGSFWLSIDAINDNYDPETAGVIYLNKESHPEITFENSPQQIKI